jgi:hypothetical protein
LNPALVQKLAKAGTTNNENYLIAARLAARLGLQRVHQVDNHTGDNMDVPDRKAFVRPLEAAWAASGVALKEQEKSSSRCRHAPICCRSIASSMHPPC